MQVTENSPQAQGAKKQRRRELLIELTVKARLLVEQGEQPSINSALLAIYREQQELPKDTQFLLFGQWKARGYKIKKGSKGFAVWASPKEATKQDGTTYDYYPVAYLFNNTQVELSNPQPKPAQA